MECGGFVEFGVIPGGYFDSVADWLPHLPQGLTLEKKHKKKPTYDPNKFG